MAAQNTLVALTLTAAVIGLVFTRRRAEPPRSTPATPSPAGPSPAGGTTPPASPGTTPITPMTTASAPRPSIDELLVTHRVLMSRVQNDIRSVDPAALETLALWLGEYGRRPESEETQAWATCVRDAIADPDYFPRACGRYPYRPGQSPIFEAPDVVTSYVAALLDNYRRMIATDLRPGHIPTQDAIERDLRGVGRTAEADQLRARRNQLYALITRNAITAIERASSPSAIARFDDRVRELELAGYATDARRVTATMTTRRSELASRGYICNSNTGCIVYSRPARDSATTVQLPVGTTLTLLNPGAPPPIGSAAGENDFVQVRFDDPVAARTASGWLLARVLAPLVDVDPLRRA